MEDFVSAFAIMTNMIMSQLLTGHSKCNAIHKTIVDEFRHAIVYGKSVKHQPQRVGLGHELADEDISMFLAVLQ